MKDHSAQEEKLLARRFLDLAEQSYAKGVPCFSDFLGLNEQNIYHSLKRELDFASPVLYGGYEFAERQMLGFLPDALSFMEEDTFREMFPICCIRITARDERYSDVLTHRDYLGAILNMGIDRSKTGDILIGDHAAWLFCHQQIAGFISDGLTKVKHTYVSCEISGVINSGLPGPRLQRMEGSVASPRIDALLALAFSASRSSLKDLPGSGKVFLNGRMVTDGSTNAKEGDLISVRGMGRFRYIGEIGRSKKGRCFAAIEKFV